MPAGVSARTTSPAAASLAIASGTNVKVVQQMLGPRTGAALFGEAEKHDDGAVEPDQIGVG